MKNSINVSIEQLEAIIQVAKMRLNNGTPNTQVLKLQAIWKSDTVGKPDSIDVFQESMYAECIPDYIGNYNGKTKN